jgi:hypothetical protein
MVGGVNGDYRTSAVLEVGSSPPAWSWLSVFPGCGSASISSMIPDRVVPSLGE